MRNASATSRTKRNGGAGHIPRSEETAAVLLLAPRPQARQKLGEAVRRRRYRVHEAGSLEEARRVLQRERVDLAMIEPDAPDGDGLTLAEELHRRRPAVPTVALSRRPTVERTVEAMRAGACDVLRIPAEDPQLDASLERARQRRWRERRTARRIGRLHRLCRKLNAARNETSQQVHVLCDDLVSAYQELAGEFQQVKLASQLDAMIEQELDLDQVLRQSLQFVLNHAGPTNAVVFLPAPEGGYSVGGYIDYDIEGDAEPMLDHLAEVAAPCISDSAGVVRCADETEVNLWLSDASEWLAGRCVAAVPCQHERENIAAVLLFRDAREPFDDGTARALEAISGVLAKQLMKLIRVHHRMSDELDGLDSGGEDELPF